MKCKKCKNEAIIGKTLCEKCRLKQNENFKRYREKKKSLKICVSCSEQVLMNHTLCEKCLSKQKNNSNNKKNKKICLDCNKAYTDNSYCEECLKKRNLRRKNYRQNKKINKICLDCSNKVKSGFSKCESCLNRIKEQKLALISNNVCTICAKNYAKEGLQRCETCNLYHINRRLYFKQNDLCLYCGNTRTNHNKYCEKCYLKCTAKAHFGKRTNWHILKDIFDKQKGICPYTGEKLILGNNTELDHIIPKSKGGENVIENLQWTSKIVNRMKSSNSEFEFLEFVKKIYEYKKLYAT